MLRETRQNGKKSSDEKPRTAGDGTSTGEELYNWIFFGQNLAMSNYVVLAKMSVNC